MEIKTDFDFLDEDDYLIKEEDFPLVCKEDFAHQIISRGEEYYNNEKVLKCIKNGNKYFAKVEGTDYEPYDVKVEQLDGYIEYSCTCPYDFPCKHEYAVLLAISNKDYVVCDLKPVVKEKKETLQEVIKKIPAEELKKYLLSNQGIDEIYFHEEAFRNYFTVYLLKQDYSYYYNNLYNDLVLKNDVSYKIDNYLLRANKYIFKKEYEEAFKIVKSIVEAYHDTDYLNNDDFIISKFSSLMLFLKAIYRGSDERLKKEIDNWKSKVENDNYYNNIYLSDILLSMN